MPKFIHNHTPDSEIVETWMYNDNDQLIEHKFSKGERLEGEFEAWHENGALYRWGMYRNGSADGEHLCWYADGQLREYELWINGNLKLLKEWYEDGRFAEMAFCEDGYYDGERKVWRKNGLIGVHSFYKKGKLNGERKLWDKHGKLTSHRYFRENISNDINQSQKCTLLNIKKRISCRHFEWVKINIIPDLLGIVCQYI